MVNTITFIIMVTIIYVFGTYLILLIIYLLDTTTDAYFTTIKVYLTIHTLQILRNFLSNKELTFFFLVSSFFPANQ